MQVHLPKIILPTITILQDAVKQLIIMVLLLLFLLIYGLDPSIHWFAMPMIITTQFLLIAACTYLVATIIPFLPDLNFLIQAGLQMLMFCSGVFYSLEMVPDQYRSIVYSINPMANLLRNYRYVLLYNQWPDWYALFFISAGSLALIIVMWLVIRKLDHVFPRVVL